MTDQVNRWHAAAIQPVTRKTQRRTVTNRQADDIGIEVLGRLQVARQDGVVVE